MANSSAPQHPIELFSEDSLGRILAGWFLILFGLVVIRSAWLSDDSYITFRVIDQFSEGHGLRYNFDERVQVFTHPLWLLLLLGVHFLTRELYLTPLFISFLCTFSAVCLVSNRFAATRLSALLALATLILSKSFVDYSTSGLENPLLYILSGLILLRFLQGQADFRNLLVLSFLIALATLTRMDSILLFLPILAVTLWGYHSWKGLLAIGMGFLPWLAWEAFSVIYYGFPFPNTAYAKLGTQIPPTLLLLKGFYYYLDLVERDPLTLCVIATGCLAPFLLKEKKQIPIVIGVMLYLVYILKIGGDFMSGRFFSVPFFICTALLSAYPLTTQLRLWPFPFCLVILTGLAGQVPGLITTSETKGSPDQNLVKDVKITPQGVADEKAFYFEETGLIHHEHGSRLKMEGNIWSGGPASRVQVVETLGFRGFQSDPETHIIDVFALADPLLARLPAIDAYRGAFRIGHGTRAIPRGYPETLRSGTNQIEDPQLAQLYEKLVLICRGDIWSRERWKAIAAMNLGKYDRWVDQWLYMNPKIIKTSLAELEQAALTAPGREGIRLEEHGIQVDLGGLKNSPVMEISISGKDDLFVLIYRDSELVGEANLKCKETGGVPLYPVEVPRAATQKGYNRIRIFPWKSEEACVFNSLRLVDDEVPAQGT